MKTGEYYYRKYVDGDDSAFEEIVKIYYDGLILFINGYLHSLTDAEDVASECLLFIAVHKRRFNFKNSLKTYLYTIARSKSLNFLKKRKRNQTENVDDYKNITSSNMLLDDLLIKKESTSELYNAIECLPSEMKTALYLFYFEDMSYEEISAITSKNLKQIDNLLYRAKKQLKEILKGGSSVWVWITRV